MPITALPDPPNRADPSNFAFRADDFLSALPVFGQELNVLQYNVELKQAVATTAANTAAASETGALISASAAAASETGAANSAFAAAASEISAANSAANSLLAVTYYGAIPPAPNLYKRWISSEDLREYVYLNDGDSNQWIEIAGPTTYQFGSGESESILFQPAGMGAIPRSIASKLRDTVSVKDFGAVGDGVTDDTAAIQAAIDSGMRVIYFPSVPVGYRLTSTLRVENSRVLTGDGTVPMTGYFNSKADGSWLYFDHSSVGIIFGKADNSVFTTGNEIHGLGSYRNQPPGSVNWQPFNHDFDIDVVRCDLTIVNYHLYNATNGIRLREGNTGRLNCYSIRGFPLNTGIQIYESYDSCRIENVHFWPFYGITDGNVWNYVLNNGKAIHLLRVDNPFLTNIFTIFYFAGLFIEAHPTAGTANKVKMINGDIDRGRHGIYVAPNATGHVGQYVNISAQAESVGAGAGIDGSAGSGLLVQASNCSITMTNVDFREHRSNAVRVEGVGNYVSISQLKINNPDTSEIGFPAVEAFTNNTVELLGLPQMSNLGSGGKYSNTGNILTEDWRPFNPIFSTAIGAFGSANTLASFYKVVGKTVSVKFALSIVDNGTGAGDVRFNVPFGNPASRAIGIGREVALTGKSFIANCDSPTITLHNYDGAYVGGSGFVLFGELQYAI